MAAKKSAKKTSGSTDGMDAIDLLIEDHRKVEELFEAYDSSKDEIDDDEKELRVAAICLELTIHASLEEEIFYPAARGAVDPDDNDLLDEAEVEHATVKDLIAQLSDMSPSDELFDAKVKVLSEYVKHHVEGEEGEIFPAVREAKVDLDALGSEMQARKDELRESWTAEEVE